MARVFEGSNQNLGCALNVHPAANRDLAAAQGGGVTTARKVTGHPVSI